jgi:hypothetical protein
MKRTLTGLAAASILIALPLAASAHDNDGRRGWNGYERHGAYYPVKPKQYYKHYQPPVVYYPGPPRIVQRPVYVPVPPPAPRPWPFNQVDIGFRIFF